MPKPLPCSSLRHCSSRPRQGLRLDTEATASHRFEVRTFVTGMPKDAAGGVETYMCVPKDARLEKGLAGLEEEVTAHGTAEDRECLRGTGRQELTGVYPPVPCLAAG